MKNTISYSDSVKRDYIYIGSTNILLGIAGFIGGTLSLLMSILGLIIITYTTLKMVFAKNEKADEMAEAYMNRAKARTMDYMLLVYLILAVTLGTLALRVDITVRTTTLIFNGMFIIYGINRLIVGLLFRKYEEE